MKVATNAGQALLELSSNIRIINLAYRTDRRRAIEGEIARLGMTLGETIRLHVASRPDSAAGFPTIGTHGCFLSHLKIIDDALSDGLDSVTIFEDDLSFSPDEIARIQDAAHAAAAHPWTIFYGGVLRYGDGLATHRQRPVFIADPGDAIMGGHFLILRRPAMAIASRYLRAILDRPAGSPDGGPMHVDGAYSWLRAAHPELMTLVANPVLGHQRASRTDIHDLRWFDRIFLLRNLVNLIRRLRF